MKTVVMTGGKLSLSQAVYSINIKSDYNETISVEKEIALVDEMYCLL